MIPNFSFYAKSITAILLLLFFAYQRYEVYSITKDFNEYKENNNAQVERARIEKSRTEAEQNAKYESAISNNVVIASRLDAALKRLRESENMSRDGGLQVAGCCKGSMPRQTENPTGAVEAARIGTGIYTPDEFYEHAMKDVSQCKQLIEFVKN